MQKFTTLTNYDDVINLDGSKKESENIVIPVSLSETYGTLLIITPSNQDLTCNIKFQSNVWSNVLKEEIPLIEKNYEVLKGKNIIKDTKIEVMNNSIGRMYIKISNIVGKGKIEIKFLSF